MGLDMYAYALAANLLSDDQVVDIPVSETVLKAVGFEPLSNDEVNALDDTAAQAYFDKRQAAYDAAEHAGYFDRNFFYWRKFNALHGWMEKLYYEKGGQATVFNCATVRLFEADLDRLEAEAGELKPVSGFFFGEQKIYPEDRECLTAFIGKAREALANGQAILYDSWW